MKKQFCLIFPLFFLIALPCFAIEYHVSTNGIDSNDGTIKNPFKTIQHAADVMIAGDICIVHSGIYREWVRPPRGGESEQKRIVYKAAKDETVIIKGSEPVSNWKKHDNSWSVEIPDSFFGADNPFKRNLEGQFIFFGTKYHLGDVYLDGKSLKEVLAIKNLSTLPMSWFVEAKDGITTIYANFGDVNPNDKTTEINVRGSIFSPSIKGLKYITIDGFSFTQAAPQWAYWNHFEEAAVSTYFGFGWIIQNCRFTDIRCVALVCGNDSHNYLEGCNIEGVGHHIVRNNYFTRCGQSAIHGNWGWAGSTIEGNLIEDINTKNEFGGMETAGIKIHYAIDVTVKNNILRRIYGCGTDVVLVKNKKKEDMEYAAIWIDWAAQGTRVTGNVVYDTEVWALFLQNNHGSPILIDNNIFSGIIKTTSEGIVFAHNLFVENEWQIGEGWTVPVFKPHTGELIKVAWVPIAYIKWWNNIFLKQSIDTIARYEGFASDYNMFYGSAGETVWGDKNSIVDMFDAAFKFTDLPKGVEVSFYISKSIFDLKAPFITRDFVGLFPLTGQGMEDVDRNPVSINTDLNDISRKNKYPVAGPFEDIKKGKNSYKIVLDIP